MTSKLPRHLLSTLLLLFSAVMAHAAEPPIEIKVVVVTMFEIGKDTGDTAGEFQLWHDRQKLDEKLKFAHHHDLYLNRKTGVLGMVTGMGTANSATAVMALALDPRFDLSKAYWLVAGIAGVDPEDAPIGSAAWAEYLVDGDLAHEIDAREIPKDWKTGYWPLFSAGPYDPKRPGGNGEVFRLNPDLTEWAYQLTRNVKLKDNEGLQKTRAKFKDHANAQKPPFVLKGDNLAGMTFWHGKLLNEWANDWTKFWTGGKGNFVTSAMEDTGSYLSLSYVHPTGKVDKERMMVLRTASNYTMPPPGVTAAQHMKAENEGYSGLNDSVEAAYAVGSVVVDEIVRNWAKYRDHTPPLKK
ncbi:purine nucleoside permease [Povalibacter uvarum]|uniref:Purine nucleoside permease n=1 Tax=Povalibacter uvarum TaxID=732238 RepID=A0A841HQB9_9GAMM|nr:purine nucleoside permease [Povalibacter uvarum]MBB6095541.1 purine nucleoside permease [Povalibacter uvarum]